MKTGKNVHRSVVMSVRSQTEFFGGVILQGANMVSKCERQTFYRLKTEISSFTVYCFCTCYKYSWYFYN